MQSVRFYLSRASTGNGTSIGADIHFPWASDWTPVLRGHNIQLASYEFLGTDPFTFLETRRRSPDHFHFAVRWAMEAHHFEGENDPFKKIPRRPSRANDHHAVCPIAVATQQCVVHSKRLLSAGGEKGMCHGPERCASTSSQAFGQEAVAPATISGL